MTMVSRLPRLRPKTDIIKGKWASSGMSAATLIFSGFVCSPPPDEGETFNPLKVDVFLQTLLSVASKSFSHSFSALGK